MAANANNHSETRVSNKLPVHLFVEDIKGDEDYTDCDSPCAICGHPLQFLDTIDMECCDQAWFHFECIEATRKCINCKATYSKEVNLFMDELKNGFKAEPKKKYAPGRALDKGTAIIWKGLAVLNINNKEKEKEKEKEKQLLKKIAQQDRKQRF